MTESQKNVATASQKPRRTVERRLLALPQPDFTHYKNANAYPGQSYFFVGHSYNVELSQADTESWGKRQSAIQTLFGQEDKWLPVRTALDHEIFCSALARFERDLLHQLPETALISPAIDEKGNLIEQSFTVWRQERRRA